MEIRAAVVAEVVALRARLAELEASMTEDERIAALLQGAQDEATEAPFRDAVLIIDADHNIVRFDAHAERLFGCEAGAVLGRNLGVLLPPEVAETHTQHVVALGASDTVQRPMGTGERVVCGRRADGTLIPIRVSIVNVPGASSAGVKAAIMREAHVQRTDGNTMHGAERALRVLRRAGEAMEGAGDEHAILTCACEVIVKEGGYEAAWVGIPEHDERRTVRVPISSGLNADHVAALDIVWSDTERGRGVTGTALRTGRSVVVQRTATDPSLAALRGITVARGFLSGAAFPLIVEGEVIAALAVAAREEDAFDAHESAFLRQLVNDVSRTVRAFRARTAQQKAEARLAQVIDAANIVVWSRSNDGTSRPMSRVIERLSGYSAEEIARQPGLMMSLVLPEDRAKAEAAMEEAQSGGRGAARVRARRRDGEVRWLEFEAHATRDARGAIVGTEGYTLDVTTQIEAARVAELEQLNEALESSNRTKDEFLAVVHHELHTPLNVMLGLCEVLQEGVYGALNQRQYRALASIDASGQRLLALVDDVLDMVAIEAGKLTLARGTMYVADLCSECLAAVRPAATAKRIEVELAVDSISPNLVADPKRLGRALSAVLSNAVKFSPEGSKVLLHAAFDAGQNTWRIAVSDRGKGLSEADRARLFEPFMQVDAKLSREHGGIGIGLALAHRLVKLHGGDIEVESAPEEGSRFTIVLPR